MIKVLVGRVVFVDLGDCGTTGALSTRGKVIAALIAGMGDLIVNDSVDTEGNLLVLAVIAGSLGGVDANKAGRAIFVGAGTAGGATQAVGLDFGVGAIDFVVGADEFLKVSDDLTQVHDDLAHEQADDAASRGALT